MNNRLSNLRGRLIASHVAVILITVILMVAISAGLLREYETKLEEQRLKEMAAPLTLATHLMPRDHSKTALRLEALDDLARENDVRVLIFEPDATVLYDTSTDENLTGETLDAYAPAIETTFSIAKRTGKPVQVFADPVEGREDPLGDNRLLIAVPGRNNASLMIGIAAPERRYPLLKEYMPSIFLVTSVAVAVASMAGYLLSKRIAAPITQLTQATRAMKAGQLAQKVPGEGADEIGRLVSSFNEMSNQVAQTYDSQRTLLADVAHELRTPLTSVQGYAQALLEGVITSDLDRNRALSVITQESRRMSVLIAQLLELARLESGQVTLDRRAISLNEVATGVIERLGPSATAKGVALEPQTDGETAALGDKDRLTQVVSNLVANAIRHTPAGGRVVITTTAGSSNRPTTIEVSDNGPGIPAVFLPHIFDRFSRADPQGVDQEGFGLGLAIVKELTERQGGHISVQSVAGEGATFTVTLPTA